MVAQAEPVVMMVLLVEAARRAGRALFSERGRERAAARVRRGATRVRGGARWRGLPVGRGARAVVMIVVMIVVVVMVVVVCEGIVRMVVMVVGGQRLMGLGLQRARLMVLQMMVYVTEVVQVA